MLQVIVCQDKSRMNTVCKRLRGLVRLGLIQTPLCFVCLFAKMRVRKCVVAIECCDKYNVQVTAPVVHLHLVDTPIVETR
jgi:hypothetical protein